MNNARRKTLKQAVALLENANNIIESVLDEEQDSYDNLPEGLMDSDRGTQMEENIDTLSNIQDEISNFIDELTSM